MGGIGGGGGGGWIKAVFRPPTAMSSHATRARAEGSRGITRYELPLRQTQLLVDQPSVQAPERVVPWLQDGGCDGGMQNDDHGGKKMGSKAAANLIGMGCGRK